MPVVLMSAAPETATADERDQVDGYLVKPFDLADVLAVVEDLTARPS